MADTQARQAHLDQNQYNLTGIKRYEKIFGKTFISTGGLETTKAFVGSLDLKPGQRVLDVGCGIGGGAFYMAKEYDVHVTGIDLSSNVINIAEEYAKGEFSGLKVDFSIEDVTTCQYPAENFDLIYSRDTILHIPDKLSLFQNFLKWLKPGGRVFISDYTCGDCAHTDEYKAYIAQRSYHLLTVKEYGKVLEEAGFRSVQAIDKTDLFLDVLKKEVKKVQGIKDDFLKEFSAADYDALVNGWEDKIRRSSRGEQTWGIFLAQK